jgi:hypothetical protein
MGSFNSEALISVAIAVKKGERSNVVEFEE